jgi:sec-independent protein translocase protein TatC
LLDQPGIANDPAFAGLLTPAEPGWFKRLFGKTELTPLQRMKQALDAEEQPDLRRLLNRSLVTVAFAGRIKPPELDLVRLELWENVDVRPQSLSPIEGFMIWMKAGLIAGLVISGPWIFYQLWLFVAAGLYPHEKKYVWVFLPISIALFVLGVLLVFVFVFDAVLAFFLGVNFNLGIDMQPRINDWLSFVLFLPLGFGLAFQLPLVMFFLNRIGVFSVAAYLSKWRIAVMVIFVVSMVLTPADPISMILLAVPLTFLYFFGVLLCKWFPGEVNPFSEATA